MNRALTIYYFSGTGNARNVARWVAEVAEEKGIKVSCVDISTMDRRHIPRPEAGSMIGFCSPTHGFNFPPVMVYFLFRFPMARGNNVFIINTRAGMKLGKWFLPGLSGLAQIMAALILLVKGYRVVGMRPIDLPSNWISLHPGLKENVVASIQIHCKGVSKKFAHTIFSGKRDYRALYDIIQDILIMPVSLLYFFIGRFIIAKTFYANHNCDNCNICIKNCPVRAILTVDNRPFWSYRCESCMRCMNECPRRAIETGHGFLAVALVLINTIIITWYYRLSAQYLGTSHIGGFAGFLLWMVECLITIGSVILIYRLFHYLLQVKIIRLATEYTSLTKYKFWRRYKGRHIKV